MGIRNDGRANALWGKGGRDWASRSRRLFGVIVVAALALTIAPAAAVAKDHDRGNGKHKKGETYVTAGLIDAAKKAPATEFDVIIQAEGGSKDAAKAARTADDSGKADRGGRKHDQVSRTLDWINGVAATLTGTDILWLADHTKALTITPDRKLRFFATNDQLWAEASGASSLWSGAGAPTGPAPTIAIVDSGIQPRAEFGDRLLTSVVINDANNSAGDGHGHGTFVAGLAAGSDDGYAGVAPTATLVSVDVLDDEGHGRSSDLIAAAEWIAANKDAYGIEVANFSVGAASVGVADPVNKAVEKLWLSGVTVVASAGNYAVDGAKSNVLYAPANDPFVITVGATDLAGTASADDDTMAPWSAWGWTRDGFAKPDLSAPGRYLVAAVPAGSTLARALPDRLSDGDHVRMSGTSFSAALVSGAAAQILALHPGFGPDQVKGALMLKANAMPLVTTRAEGVGELDVAASAAVSSPPNPNLGLRQFVSGSEFDDVAWYTAASASSSWDESTWTESTWTESTWYESTWTESTWSESTWTESTWTESTWTESTWDESTWTEGTLVQ
jgi:serine protease AprX